MLPSMRTKRRRVATEVSNFLIQLENDSMCHTVHSENLTAVTVLDAEQNLQAISEASNFPSNKCYKVIMHCALTSISALLKKFMI